MAFSSTTKYNYIDVVNHMIPEFYRETDFFQYGSEEDVSLTFLGKILKAAIQNNLFLDVSNALMTDPLDMSAIAPYFVPDGNTSIGPNEFEKRFMVPYGLNFESFATSQEIDAWVRGTFLPDIECNNPVGLFGVLSGYGFGTFATLSSVHAYCKEYLGLFYFMNTPSLSGTGGDTSGDCSAIMADYLLTPILRGELATEQEAINALFSFFWHNRESSTYYGSFIPTQYASGVADISGNTYLSGTQMLDAIKLQLQSWTDPRLKNHEFLKDSLTILIGDGTVAGMGEYPKKMRDAGPFQRFLKAVSLGIADINLILEEINDLLSIDECPEKFLELLANNIGWRFLTGEYSKWRAQLRNAVMLYKTKGSVVGLDAACKLIFPDNTFAASDVSEAWECYLPKLVYYLVKTESFITKEGLEFARTEDQFNGSQPPNVRFNQAPSRYESGKDRNYRFLVDAILQDMHNKFCTIRISGKSFEELPMWTCLPEDPVKGFWHRNYPSDPGPPNQGFYVAVPPWEKYGFYKEAELGRQEIDYLCKTLSGSRNDFGFEVNPVYVQAFKDLCDKAIGTMYALSGTPILANNNKFRLFTSGHELPPNYHEYVEYGYTSGVSDFDVWNTKSSHIFAAFDASTLDYTIDRYDTFRNKGALDVFVDILKEFVPFHVVLRLVLYEDLEDTHCARSVLCVVADDCVDDFNTGYLNSYRTNFWAGASGTGDLSTTYTNGDGRVLPSYDAASSTFWQYSATDLDRNTSRRRNYRYALECYPYTRIGKGMPVALTHYAIATSNADVNADPYISTWEYILKGFNYELQTYLDPSSSVWDSSAFFNPGTECVGGGSTGGFDLSNTYPVRAVPDTESSCSSLVVYRNVMDDVLEVMTSRSIRESVDYVDLKFSDLDYRSFTFGTTVHENYSYYKNEFSGVLSNWIAATIPFYGGHNFISYAYGPTIWNSDFRYKGLIDSNIGTDPSPAQAFPWSYGYRAQWSHVVGGTEAQGQKYKNYLGRSIVLEPTYFDTAPDASSITSPQGVIHTRDPYGHPYLATKEILSGIEIRQTSEESKSFIVVSDASAHTDNSILAYTATLFTRDSNPLTLVVPFDPTTIGLADYNRLRPQSQFGLDIFAKTKRGVVAQEVVVELVTSGVTDDSGDEMVWGYNWIEQKWIPRPSKNSDDFEDYKNHVCVRTRDECPVAYRLDFHTQDDRTVKSIPCHGVIKTGQVHKNTTGYLLKIYNKTPSPLTRVDAVEIHEISIVDKVLNGKTNYFNSKETNTIYTFWDSLTTGSYSRDSTYSTSSFETSGGSRAEYLELLGGDLYSASGNIDGGGGSSIDFITYGVEDGGA